MSNQINERAIVGRNVLMGSENTIGPHVVIEDGVVIGSENRIWANAYLCAGTTVGDRNQIHMGACVGHIPQDIAFKESSKTFTKIGDRNIIREYVTIHRGTKEGTSTVIGNDNFIMANAHIAHNCQIGNRVIMVNLASLTGYCIVEDQVFISGITGFHQFSRIGRLAMVSALSAVNKDIPPFMVCGGRPGVIQGVNVVGMRRAGISQTVRSEIKETCRILYRSGLSVSSALSEIERKFTSEEVRQLLKFIRESKRGICAGQGQTGETLLSRKGAAWNAASEDTEETEKI